MGLSTNYIFTECRRVPASTPQYPWSPASSALYLQIQGLRASSDQFDIPKDVFDQLDPNDSGRDATAAELADGIRHVAGQNNPFNDTDRVTLAPGENASSVPTRDGALRAMGLVNGDGQTEDTPICIGCSKDTKYPEYSTATDTMCGFQHSDLKQNGVLLDCGQVE